MEQNDPMTEADHDREVAEVIESASVQNAVAVVGLSALLLLPVAWLLTGLGQLARGILRRLRRAG